jgi:hypothetical protein
MILMGSSSTAVLRPFPNSTEYRPTDSRIQARLEDYLVQAIAYSNKMNSRLPSVNRPRQVESYPRFSTIHG